MNSKSAARSPASRRPSNNKLPQPIAQEGGDNTTNCEFHQDSKSDPKDSDYLDKLPCQRLEEILNQRIALGVVVVCREELRDGAQRITLRNFLP